MASTVAWREASAESALASETLRAWIIALAASKE